MTTDEIKECARDYFETPAAYRKNFLLRLMRKKDGPDVICGLYYVSQELPDGTTGPRGTFLRQTMIPAIVAHDYTKSNDTFMLVNFGEIARQCHA